MIKINYIWFLFFRPYYVPYGILVAQPGIEPVSPALKYRVLATALPGTFQIRFDLKKHLYFFGFWVSKS